MSSANIIACDVPGAETQNLNWDPTDISTFCSEGNCTVWPSSLPEKFDNDQTIPLGTNEEEFATIAVNIVIQLATDQISEKAGSTEFEGKTNLLNCSERFKKNNERSLYLKDIHLICEQRYVPTKEFAKDSPIELSAENKATKETCETFDGIKEKIYDLIDDPDKKSAAKESCTKACSNSLSAGAIAGIVIGCVVGVILIGGIIFFVMKSN